MRIALVTMPWGPVDVPSLALGILTTTVSETVPEAETHTVNANLEYADWAAEKIGLDGEEYSFFSEQSYFSGCGDWIFSSALYDDPDWRTAEFEQTIAPGLPEPQRRLARRLHQMAPAAIDHLTELILDTRPVVVGFTTTFQQNVASLAAARRIKELAPQAGIVFGGANCDGPQGAALHRNFSYVDFVVRGEGEAVFPELVTVLAANGSSGISESSLARIDGLCYRTVDGGSRANPMAAQPLAVERIASPNYDDYFARFSTSIARSWAEPMLTVEGSRGCWWGEKHHCTFCGLNGSFMKFRGKRPGRFLEEILELSRRHRVLDLIVVDNILEMSYLKSFLPALAETGYDLRIHYEIKANMRRSQLQLLHDAGAVIVQPGIENLSTCVLKLMDKGVTGCQNVRLLRDAESVGVAVSWNYLYGFPGEEPADYTTILDQIPALHHLPPPTGCSRIGIERFSPYEARPELGFEDLRPAAHYPVIYDLPEAELGDLAYLFSAPDRGIDDGLSARVSQTLGDWRAAHNTSRLTHCDLGEEIVLVSDRGGFDWSVRRITAPLELAAFRLLDQPRSVESLARRLSEETGTVVGDGRLDGVLVEWRELGVLFEESDHLIHIAPEAANSELTRLGDLQMRSRG